MPDISELEMNICGPNRLLDSTASLRMAPLKHVTSAREVPDSRVGRPDQRTSMHGRVYMQMEATGIENIMLINEAP
jgi:hypothetical protein